jgi:CRISPR/Cas system CSM-associated protein Csm4 (group 5 of RAMP superfamily)
MESSQEAEKCHILYSEGTVVVQYIKIYVFMEILTITLEVKFQKVHCGKKHQNFPSQITDAADHNKPVTKNSGINFPTSLLDCSAIYIRIFSAMYFGIKIS